MAVATAKAETPATIIALTGLSPVASLERTQVGKDALQANFAVTAAVQSGAAHQPLLQPFPEQQKQALRDIFITGGNAFGLADGLGTRLGGVYQRLTGYTNDTTFGSISATVASLFLYSGELIGANANAAKFFFANATTDGSSPVSASVKAILSGGVTDIYGRAYRLAAGSEGADPYGNSRPFQTEPDIEPMYGEDFFGKPINSLTYLYNLRLSPSFPSGHATYAYAEAVLLAILVSERFPEEITRAAEYSNNRIIVGAHYAMDVIAGRTLALHDIAQLLANNRAYLDQILPHASPITDYRATLETARADMRSALQPACGSTITACAADDTGRFHDPAANRALYESTQTYGLPVVYPETAASTEDVAKLAPEAGYLLTAAFPFLTLAQADDILTSTEGPGGGFLDNGSSFGVYSRIDLYAAAQKALSVGRGDAAAK